MFYSTTILHESPLDAVVNRVLAAATESAPLDYTVLSVAVITLSLILVVELIRHRLDVAATGRPFFKTVLEGVYRELATLGCVEFFVFILHKYYSGLNIEQELVFADVHFTLFFTALFNAFQSCLLAFCTTRVSERQWVKTEQLEVDHYVEIREEFERVEVLLYGEDQERRQSAPPSRHGSLTDGASDSSFSLDIMDAAEPAFEFNCRGVSRSCKEMSRYVRHPYLYQKHQKLLVQIRFHELRIHFLQSNDLPLKFKVSDYLKRSELAVLIRLIHISTFAWLMLLGGVTLVYYFMGIVIFVTEDLSKVGLSLTWIFMGSMMFSVVLSLLIFNKMKSIFSTIMRKRLTSEVSGRKEVSTRVGGNTEITSQQDLFWGGNPKFIRSIIQFMQFGFAIALSILLVFWKDIDVSYAPVPAWGILLCVLSCYAAFVAIMCQVLPRYTLCTSLGQLVDEDRLKETVAQWRLQEAQRKQRQKMIDPDYYDDDDDDGVSWNPEDSSDELDDDENDDASSRSSSIVMGPIVAAKKVFTEGFAFMRKPSDQRRSKTYEDIDFGRGKTQSEHFTAATGSWDISDTPHRKSSPLETGDPATMSREERIRARQARRKSKSVGVAVMRNLGETRAAAEAAAIKEGDQKETRPREVRRRSLSASEDIKKMRRTLLMAELVQTDTKELRKKAGVEAKPSLTTREQRMQARRNRRKSTSDGVALMRSVMEADRKELLDPDASPAVSAPIRAQRRERRRSVSAAANIQHMRDMTLSSEEPPISSTLRRPRSRQSSGGVLRLEPLVEGVAADHSDSSLNILASTSVEIDDSRVNGHLTDSKARSSSPATVESDEKGTKGTMDSASTVGDGHSDADDIPDVDLDEPRYLEPKPEPRPSLSESLHWYFSTKKYRLFSAVFGTFICFFLVGARVETLLISSCMLPDNGNTWHIKLGTAFWMEVAWLGCFIVVGLYNAVVFRPGNAISNKERSQFVSAVLDTILCSTCLILLMLAESQRCCPDAEQRFLADAPTVGAGEKEDDYYCEDKYDKPEYCCPSYGDRIYGGLGNIEPFTALIVLRLIRFRVGEKIVALMDRRLKWSDRDTTPDKSLHESLHPFHPYYSKRKASRLEKKTNLETEAAIDLWTKATAARPDLVDQYGEFSSEILKAMLGIDVACSPGVPRTIEHVASPEKGAEGEMETEALLPTASPDMAVTTKAEYLETRRQVDMKYPHMSQEARSMIISSKVGKPALPKRDSQTNLASSLKQPALKSSLPQQQDKPKLAFADNNNNVEAPPAKVQFNIPPKHEVAFESRETAANFAAPNARLLRSMRRCDRKLLPLLNKWTIVDVVITKWEIVYFDASDVEGTYGSVYSEQDIKHIETVRQAVVATKGGKGLRLKDVAAGRKVVGHLELAAIDSIHVDRIMPSESEDQQDEPPSDGSDDVQSEFWKANKKSDGDAHMPSRTERWEHVKQDRLRVHSDFGTLLLRFYGDLDDSECNPIRCANESESDGALFKDNAFQWCQTIGRLCGTNQLKQKLPHFGEDNDEELRDYLVVVDSKTFQDNPRHMRRKSFGNVLKDHTPFLAMLSDDSEPAEVPPPPPHGPSGVPKPPPGRRLSSFGNSVAPKKRPSKMLRRLSSTGDIPSSSREVLVEESTSSDLPPQSNSKSEDGVDAEAGKGPDLV